MIGNLFLAGAGLGFAIMFPVLLINEIKMVGWHAETWVLLGGSILTAGCFIIGLIYIFFYLLK